MKVLSWNQKRKKLLRQFAELDAAVARRVSEVETAWQETAQEFAAPEAPNQAAAGMGMSLNELEELQEYSTAEDVLLQPKPPISIEIQGDPQEMGLPDEELAPTVISSPKKKSLASYLD